MTDMPDGLDEEEREIWTSSIPVAMNPVMNTELQDMGVDTRIRRTTQRLHDPKPLLVKLAAFRVGNARLREALAALRGSIALLYGEYKAHAQFGEVWEDADAALVDKEDHQCPKAH